MRYDCWPPRPAIAAKRPAILPFNTNTFRVIYREKVTTSLIIHISLIIHDFLCRVECQTTLKKTTFDFQSIGGIPSLRKSLDKM